MSVRSGCPQISEQALKFYKEEMARHEKCFAQKGLSCNVGSGQLIDDTSSKGCETAYIGRDHTFHTHKCGVTPSKADYDTTRKLGRRFLCIGEDETKKVHCFDLQNGGRKVSCVF